MRFASSAQREQDRSLLSGQTVNAGQTRLQDYKAFVAQVRASFTLVSIRGQHRPFAVCAPAPFAGTPAARKGISKFNQIGEPVNAGSMGREMPRHLAAHRAEMPPLSEES